MHHRTEHMQREVIPMSKHMTIDPNRAVEWVAEQACAECGKGPYLMRRMGEAVCDVCGHENPMDAWNLSANEAHVWNLRILRGVSVHALAVVAYEPESEEL